MGEMTLRAYCDEERMRAVSLRYFTAYGPRCPESHAVMAMIARAMIDQDPFEIWGTGEQIRNWTHVSDVVEGTLRAAERIDDGSAVNIGTTERTRVIDCAREVVRYMGKDVEFVCDPSKPTGPYNRVSDDARCRRLLGWAPTVRFRRGSPPHDRLVRRDPRRGERARLARAPAHRTGAWVRRSAEPPSTDATSEPVVEGRRGRRGRDPAADVQAPPPVAVARGEPPRVDHRFVPAVLRGRAR